MGRTEELFERWMNQKYLVEDLSKDSTIKMYDDARATCSSLEDEFKKAMKEEGVDELKGGKWEVTMRPRTSKPTIYYDISAIEKEPWGAGCIVKAVNGTVFDAIIKGLGIKPDPYVTMTPGTTTNVVTIKELKGEELA